jgi:hypothetical protein
VNIVSTGFSAIRKLALLAGLLGVFLFSMATVVYMSLSGQEIKVPEIVGRDFVESEKELAALGLKIKRRAERPSTEKINTILEQLPKPGETVKTGQLILVVVSKAGLEGEDKPKSLIKDLDDDDSQKIEEMISDKPKKPRANTNANAKRKADTTRDVNSAEAEPLKGDDDSKPKADNSNRSVASPPGPDKPSNRSVNPAPVTRPQNTQTKPGSGDTRPRQSNP